LLIGYVGYNLVDLIECVVAALVV